MQKKRRGSAASSQGSKASATAGTGDKQTLKSEKEDGEKDEYGDDFEEDKTEGKKKRMKHRRVALTFFFKFWFIFNFSIYNALTSNYFTFFLIPAYLHQFIFYTNFSSYELDIISVSKYVIL